MSGLRTIVYTSHVTRPFGVADLEALLTEARARNREQGVTGVRLYGTRTRLDTTSMKRVSSCGGT